MHNVCKSANGMLLTMCIQCGFDFLQREQNMCPTLKQDEVLLTLFLHSVMTNMTRCFDVV